MKKHTNNDALNNMDQFIGKLQNEDQRNLRLTRTFQWFMWGMSILYAYIFIIRGWNENTIYRQIGWSLYVLSFLSFGFIFNYLKRSYQHIDYGLPTLMMLKEAAGRYKLFQRKLIMAITPILFIDAGMVLVTFEPGTPESLLRSLLITQALLIPAAGIGLIIGIIIWRKRQKPIRDFALRMIEELEE
jgi:hypothetical protein